MNFAAVLLCGGRSTRMGRDKALLDWEGMPLWQFQLRKLRALEPTRLLVSCRAEQNVPADDYEAVLDPPDTDDGPLGAITRCLSLVDMPLLVLAVDMPWMTTCFLRDEILPGAFFRGAHGYEALAAVYQPVMLPALQSALQARQLALQRILTQIAPMTREVTPEHAPLFRNANTADELRG